jgi:hypothetical protein
LGHNSASTSWFIGTKLSLINKLGGRIGCHSLKTKLAFSSKIAFYCVKD